MQAQPRYRRAIPVCNGIRRGSMVAVDRCGTSECRGAAIVQQFGDLSTGCPGSSIESGRCIMQNCDVSDGFLVLTTAGFVLLCSSLLALVFG